ncbi:MAG: aminotransferase class I/II-fold pyridoxal phosphate-dependent enzyme, partial [Rubrobacteraceae bacterium]
MKDARKPSGAPRELLLNPVLEQGGEYPLLRMDESRRELQRRGVPIFDFGTGDPREPTDPTIRQALVEAVPETSQYPSAAGKINLREAFRGWAERRHGVALDPETEVLPAAGSKEAIFHAPLAFIHPSHERRGVAYGTPGYPVYERGTQFAGGVPLPVELKKEDGFLLPVRAIDPEKT